VNHHILHPIPLANWAGMVKEALDLVDLDRNGASAKNHLVEKKQ